MCGRKKLFEKDVKDHCFYSVEFLLEKERELVDEIKKGDIAIFLVTNIYIFYKNICILMVYNLLYFLQNKLNQ